MDAYLGRRRFVLGSAAFLTQLALLERATAQTVAPGNIPTVDSLKITVLMDSSHDIFLRAPTPKWVKVKRTPGFADYRKTLHNQWGLSLALESKSGADTRSVLLDFGYQPETFVANCEMMGLDPSKLDALILSHGHYDHFGGLLGYLAKNRQSLKRDITLYVGGEDNFCERKRRTPTPGHFTDFGYLDRAAIDGQKVRIVTCEQPTRVADHAFTSGTVQRSSFETVLPNTLVVFDRKGAVGCDPSAFPTKEHGKPVHDEHVHEHATCYNLRERGLVVITSCGHAGIINTVRQAMDAAGVKKLHALVGGFHLAVAEDGYLKRTVGELKALNPDVVIPMHCSGTNFLEAMRASMPERLALSTTGSEFTLGA